MNLSDSPKTKLGTLCALYVAQGIPWGFVVITLAAHITTVLADQGKSDVEVATAVANVIALSVLPWSLKFLWGPLIDRFNYPAMGKRRPWILVAQAMMALTIGAMIFIGDIASNIALLGTMVLIHNIFNSLQDVSVDALAVDLLEEHERGRANGLMFASKYVGTFIGGSTMGSIVVHYGFNTALITQFFILLAIMMLPLFLRERKGEKLFPWSKGKSMLHSETIHSTMGLLRSTFKALSLKSALLTVGLALCINIGAGVLAITGPLLTKKLGWSQEEFTTIIGGYGIWVQAAASVLGGLAADKLGARKMIALGAFISGGIWIYFSMSEHLWGNMTWFISMSMAEAFFIGFTTVCFFSLAMKVSWPKVAATQFTLYMAMLNLSTIIASKIQPLIFAHTDFVGLYLYMGIFQLAMIGLIPFIDAGQTRRVLGEG